MRWIKMQLPDWARIVANHISEKGLISGIYEEHYNPRTQKQTTWFKKWAEDLNRHFPTEDTHMANGHMKRCSASVIIKEMQIKITMRDHLTPVRMAIFKKTTNNECWWGCGDKETLMQYWWKCISYQTLWKTVWRILKKLKIMLSYMIRRGNSGNSVRVYFLGLQNHCRWWLKPWN